MVSRYTIKTLYPYKISDLQGMGKLTPIQCYREAVRQGKIISDPVQESAILVTQQLYEGLIHGCSQKQSVFDLIKQKIHPGTVSEIKGIYFWGGVGTGKTFIVDTFFESLPIQRKLRIHFHRFMQRIHGELKEIQNVEDPLQYIADDFAKQIKVLCFDEFHVSDITDAMLLSGLLRAMFERGIILVASSNEHPDQLYHDGLQRSRFIPAIELIKRYTRVIHIDSGVDYRLRYLDTAEIYHHPLDQYADQVLATNFQNVAPNVGRPSRTIEIGKRKIQTVHCADGVVWFEFSTICNSPRGVADYIEIARQFQTVLIANVPQMQEEMNDQAKRFISLVDEFYDRNVKLIITAAVIIDKLYSGKKLQFQFERTRSRLIEMQSHDYLGQGHIPD
jgi:cell division protein ZapE